MKRFNMKCSMAIAAYVCGAVAATGAEAATPSFVAGPAMVRQGENYTLSFEVDTATDVTVFVVDGTGNVVRRLGFGALGDNAPQPFQKGALRQTIVWDGKDEAGQPAPPGCRIRVGLGMTTEFSRFLRSEKQGLPSRGPVAMAVDGAGTLYNVHGHVWMARLGYTQGVKAFDREGRYLRTINPFRADWPQEKVSAVQWIRLADGRDIPATGPDGMRPFNGFLQGFRGMGRSQALVSREGRLILPGGRAFEGPDGQSRRRLLALGTDGSAAREWYFGPPLPAGASPMPSTFLAFSPDEQYIYLTGFHMPKSRPTAGVWRVQWHDSEPPAKPFIGTATGSGTGEGEFDEPRGLAVAADGRLAVGDYRNDRVQVFSPDGRFIKALPVTGPDTVLIHPKTGSVYVLSVRDKDRMGTYGSVRWEMYGDKSVIKFKSLDDWIEQARLDLPKTDRYFHDTPPIIALDASAAIPQLWLTQVGHQDPDHFLWRIEDRGDQFVEIPHHVIRFHRGRGTAVDARLAVDRKANAFYVLDGGNIERYAAANGDATPLELQWPDKWKDARAADKKFHIGKILMGPDGLLYVRARLHWPGFWGYRSRHRDPNWMLCRFNPETGAVVPFKFAGEGIPGFGRHAGEKSTEFAVAPDGTVYVTEFAGPEGPYCQVTRFRPDGRHDGVAVSEMTRTGGTMAVGPDGALYVADAVRPADKKVPDFIGEDNDPRDHLTRWYGVLARFDRGKGGAFSSADGDGLEVLSRVRFKWRQDGRMSGAAWTFYGLSPLPTSGHCECSIATIDMDGFGRLFVPDVATHSVMVLDPAGNLVHRFGGYGGYDSQGPKSDVPVPAIPLWYPREVAVADNCAAVVDVNNRRILLVNMGFATVKETP